jgi:hypothetical protein
MFSIFGIEHVYQTLFSLELCAKKRESFKWLAVVSSEDVLPISYRSTAVKFLKYLDNVHSEIGTTNCFPVAWQKSGFSDFQE